jgi:flagellar biosynthesis/type III secretory pathway M-ring protein FliF/YscJ
MTVRRIRNHGRTTIGVVAVLLLWPLAATAASASTGPAPGSDRAAAVQAVLDRVLGPGNSSVVVSETIQTSTTGTTSVRWGSGVVASVAASEVTTSGGTTLATVQQRLVGGTATVVATPAGTHVDQTVAVAVDRAHLGTTSLATVRRLVTAAAGIVPSRGDRVSVVAARFAPPVPVRTAAVGPLTMLLPFAVPAIWALGALGGMAVIAAAVRGGRHHARPGTGVQRV